VVTRLRTWHAELAVVALILGATVAATAGAWREIVGSLAVLAGFAHAQVSERLAEHAKLTDRFASNVNGHLGQPAPGSSHHAYCWRWSSRYFLAKELLWLVYFVSLQAWSALVGVAVFLLYPLWRRLRSSL
jgi:hypothetical protein